MQQRAVIIGVSGLIGNHLLQHLLNDNDFTAVKVLVRKKLEIEHTKLQQVLVDFNNLDDYANKLGTGEIIFCCVGTTNKKVQGDNAAYEKVDFDIPVNAAKIASTKNFKKFLLVSSAGANVNSKYFYLKLKGKTEKALQDFSFSSISIFRPGQLLGRRNEKRRGEKILQGFTKLISFFLFGSFKKYHSINAKDVAQAMVLQSKMGEEGIKILEYPEIKKMLDINKDQHLQ